MFKALLTLSILASSMGSSMALAEDVHTCIISEMAGMAMRSDIRSVTIRHSGGNATIYLYLDGKYLTLAGATIAKIESPEFEKVKAFNLEGISEATKDLKAAYQELPISGKIMMGLPYLVARLTGIKVKDLSKNLIAVHKVTGGPTGIVGLVVMDFGSFGKGILHESGLYLESACQANHSQE